MTFHLKLRAVCIAGTLLSPTLVIAGELMPYQPPDSPPRLLEKAPVQRAAVVVPEERYVEFAARASQLTPGQREQLTASFEQRRSAAAESGDVSRAIHYQRLLDILGRQL